MGAIDEEYDDDQDEQPTYELRELSIPDGLVTWAQRPEVARTMRVMWGKKLERELRALDQQPVSSRRLERVLGLLEPIVTAAVRDGRADLLAGLDTQTAEWMKLTFKVGDVTVGHRGRWSFHEVALVQATDDPQGARAFVEKVKDLVADAFPEARVSSIGRPTETQCRRCGEPIALAAVELDKDLVECLPCWVSELRPAITEPSVVAGKPGRRRKGEKKTETVPTTQQLGLYGDDDWE